MAIYCLELVIAFTAASRLRPSQVGNAVMQTSTHHRLMAPAALGNMPARASIKVHAPFRKSCDKDMTLLHPVRAPNTSHNIQWCKPLLDWQHNMPYDGWMLRPADLTDGDASRTTAVSCCQSSSQGDLTRPSILKKCISVATQRRR